MRRVINRTDVDYMIVANLVLLDGVISNGYLKKCTSMQLRYLKGKYRRFSIPIIQLPLLPDDLIGKEQLEQAGRLLYGL
jgi:hypothetical protein